MEGAPSLIRFVKNGEGVAIETPSLHFLKKMDKAFCIALRFSFENLWQCNGWPAKPLGGRAPLPDPNSRILKQCNGWPAKPLPPKVWMLHF